MYYGHYVLRITTEEIGSVGLSKVARVEICDIVTKGKNTVVHSSTPDGIITVTKETRLRAPGQYGSRNCRQQRIVKHVYQIEGELLDKDEAVEAVQKALNCSIIEADEYIKTLPQLTI